MLGTVQRTIRRHELIAPGDCVAVAVSGGADSMCLLHVLAILRKSMEFRLIALHLHHGIRGPAADLDQQLVTETCRSLGVELLVKRARVPALARKKGVSLEMAARAARQSFFREALQKQKCDCIATAHTQDDQAETILLRLLRGAGMEGLGGMLYRRSLDGPFSIKPMLDVTHREAVGYLRRHQLAWREDESNQDLAMMRNRIRHEVMPLLKKRINPRMREALLRTADIIRAESAWMDLLTGVGYESAGAKGDSIVVGILRSRPVAEQRRVLLLWLRSNGVDAEFISFDSIARILNMLKRTDGSSFLQLSPRHRVVREYGSLYLRATESSKPGRPAGDTNVLLNADGVTRIPGLPLKVEVKRRQGFVVTMRQRPGELPAVAYLNARKWKDRPLMLRLVKPGDRFRPMGAGGRKKIQDILVDAKVPQARRAAIPVVLCGRTIIWIPGYTIAEGWQVPTAEAPSLQIKIESV